MAKKKIILSESEFKALIENAVNNTLNEIEGGVSGVLKNASKKVEYDEINGMPSQNPKNSNLDDLEQGARLCPQAAESLIAPYRTSYLFHSTDLLGVAALIVFNLKELYKLTSQEAILKGEVYFNHERLSDKGSIFVNLNTQKVWCNAKSRSPKYHLIINPSKKELWERLIYQLKKAVS